MDGCTDGRIDRCKGKEGWAEQTDGMRLISKDAVRLTSSIQHNEFCLT